MDARSPEPNTRRNDQPWDAASRARVGTTRFGSGCHLGQRVGIQSGQPHAVRQLRESVERFGSRLEGQLSALTRRA